MITQVWVSVSCDRCAHEVEVELESSNGASWPHNTDRLYEHLERKGWTWEGKDLCPPCSDGPTKEDIADYKAYHQGEGVHTP